MGGLTWLATEDLGNGSWKVMIKRSTGPDTNEVLDSTELKGYSKLGGLEGYNYKRKALTLIVCVFAKQRGPRRFGLRR